jgi:hypothetical protein
MSRGAIYVSDSGNSKLSHGEKIDTTYVSIKGTCSDTCPLKQSKTCYAMNSFVGIINRRMNRRARQSSPLALAQAEARTIDESYNGGPVPTGRCLRVHTAGDSRTWAGTRLIAAAVKRWKARGGGHAFTYTHSHAHVPREMWGSVSVLASIESTDQVAAVRAMGYAPAIVVSEHASDKAGVLPGSDTVFIPCPAQTRGVSCVDCGLCMRGDWLFVTNRGISFAAHGIRKNDLKRHLKMV